MTATDHPTTVTPKEGTKEAGEEFEEVEEVDEEQGNNQGVTTTLHFAKSPSDVLFSKFVIGQVIFNVIASFLGPLGTFYLLFGYLSQGPYEWSSGPLVGVVVGSLVGSPLLIFALMPVGMPEAVENGWFPCLRTQDCPPWMMTGIFWFLGEQSSWRWALKRNIMLAIVLGLIYVPFALLLARYAFGPSLSTWTLIWFNVVYEVLLAIPVTALGLLGYSVQHHLEFTLSRMSSNPNVAKRLGWRILSSLKLTFWPY